MSYYIKTEIPENNISRVFEVDEYYTECRILIDHDEILIDKGWDVIASMGILGWERLPDQSIVQYKVLTRDELFLELL